MTPATPAQMAELHDLANRYQALSGHQGYLNSYQPSETGAERFTFGDGATVLGIEKALGHQRALLDKVSECFHEDVARFQHSDDYCRACGANLDRATMR